MDGIPCVADVKARLGEGPCWDAATSRLYWFDIKNAKLFAQDPDGAIRDWTLPSRASAAAPLADHTGLLISSEQGLICFNGETGKTGLVEAFPPLEPGFRSNDGRADQHGGFWWSTMDDDGGKRAGTVWRFDGQKSRLMVDGIHISNCLAFSPDGRTAYLADTPKQTIWAFDWDAEAGLLANRRVFVQGTGRGNPDGACIDAEGYLWVAIWGGGRIDRYAPDGRLDRSVETPVSQPSSVIFGGPGLETLYITSAWDDLSDEARDKEPLAGGLFAFRPGVTGLRIPPVQAEP